MRLRDILLVPLQLPWSLFTFCTISKPAVLHFVALDKLDELLVVACNYLEARRK